jgi:hypothetical protein
MDRGVSVEPISIPKDDLAETLVVVQALAGRTVRDAFNRCHKLAQELQEPWRSKLLEGVEAIYSEFIGPHGTGHGS